LCPCRIVVEAVSDTHVGALETSSPASSGTEK